MLELEANEAAGYDVENDENTEDIAEVSPVPWHITFREQRQKIIELWDLCFVSIIHRTQFYMLFKGDPADEIYMEVELRRLSWLEQHLTEHGNATPARGGATDGPTISISSRLISHLLLCLTSIGLRLRPGLTLYLLFVSAALNH